MPSLLVIISQKQNVLSWDWWTSCHWCCEEGPVIRGNKPHKSCLWNLKKVGFPPKNLGWATLFPTLWGPLVPRDCSFRQRPGFAPILFRLGTLESVAYKVVAPSFKPLLGLEESGVPPWGFLKNPGGSFFFHTRELPPKSVVLCSCRRTPLLFPLSNKQVSWDDICWYTSPKELVLLTQPADKHM